MFRIALPTGKLKPAMVDFAPRNASVDLCTDVDGKPNRLYRFTVDDTVVCQSER